MSRQAGSIVRGNSKPRRISVKAGRQQVRLCTAGAAKGQGRRELARIDSRPFWLPLYRHPRSNPLLHRLGLSGLSPPMRQPDRRNGYRILLALPFALCSAADLNISLTLSEQDLTLPGAVRVIDKEKSCQSWMRQFANVPTISGAPMVNRRARRMFIG